MAISTSSIFHFTESLKTVFDILQDGFKVTYCAEEYLIGEGSVELGICMVSFADIPLAQLNQSVSEYGKFCIGLSKEWAGEKGINPVLYMEQFSSLSNVFCDYLEMVQKIPNLNVKFEMENVSEQEVKIKYVGTPENEITIKMINGLISFIKNSRGTLKRRNKKDIPNFNFYAEREWRYVPSENDFLNAPFTYIPYIKKDELENWRNMDGTKMFIPNLTLNFDYNDITHIIVKNESDINEIINFIKSSDSKVENKSQIDILLTKITSFERLNNDF